MCAPTLGNFLNLELEFSDIATLWFTIVNMKINNFLMLSTKTFGKRKIKFTFFVGNLKHRVLGQCFLSILNNKIIEMSETTLNDVMITI